MGVDAARLTRLKFMGKRIRGYAPWEIRDNSRNMHDPVSRGARRQRQPPRTVLSESPFTFHVPLFSIRHNTRGRHTLARVRELCATCGGIAVSSHVILVFRACHRLYAISIKLARLRHLSTSKWNYSRHLILFREIRVPRVAIVTISTKF